MASTADGDGGGSGSDNSAPLRLEDNPILNVVLFPPPASLSQSALEAKSDRVHGIIDEYCQPPEDDSKAQNKLNSTIHGMLYVMPDESLNALHQSPALAEITCNDAMAFNFHATASLRRYGQRKPVDFNSLQEGIKSARPIPVADPPIATPAVASSSSGAATKSPNKRPRALTIDADADADASADADIDAGTDKKASPPTTLSNKDKRKWRKTAGVKAKEPPRKPVKGLFSPASSGPASSPPASTKGARRLALQTLQRAEEQAVLELAQRPGASWEPANRAGISREVHDRDGDMCVVTGKVVAIEGAHIVPFSINHSTGAVVFLNATFYIAQLLFGKAFADRAQQLLGSVTSSDEHWNMIYLNNYLHKLFDKSLFGIRPATVTKETDEDSSEYYVLHMTCHWLFKNGCLNKFNRAPGPSGISDMLRPTPDFQLVQHRMCDFVAVSGQKVREGFKFSIKHKTFEDALNMFVMLGFRWTVATISCLAGAAGLSEEEYDRDQDEFIGPLTYGETMARAGLGRPGWLPGHMRPSAGQGSASREDKRTRPGSSEETTSSGDTARTGSTNPTSIEGDSNETDRRGTKLVLSVTQQSATATSSAIVHASGTDVDEPELEDSDQLDQLPKDPAIKTQPSVRGSRAIEVAGATTGSSQEKDDLASDIGNLNLGED